LVNTSENHWQHWEDLPPEKEAELIEKLARTVVEHNISEITEMLLEIVGPTSDIFATMGMGLFGPFLEFFGVDTYTALFRKRDAYKRLMVMIKKIRNEDKKRVINK
jgi:hypothetical protein